jgi:hypothetical protein
MAVGVLKSELISRGGKLPEAIDSSAKIAKVTLINKILNGQISLKSAFFGIGILGGIVAFIICLLIGAGCAELLIKYFGFGVEFKFKIFSYISFSLFNIYAIFASLVIFISTFKARYIFWQLVTMLILFVYSIAYVIFLFTQVYK